MVDIDTCHMLLGRPCPYDRDALYRCKDNVYIFVKAGRKITFAPMREENQPKASKLKGNNLLTIGNVVKELKEMVDDIRPTNMVENLG